MSLKMIAPIDRDALRDQVRSAEPFPHLVIDGFLKPEVADEVWSSLPTFEEALGQGRSFKAVNERGKVQITDSTMFPEPVARLNAELASEAFCDLLTHVMEIPGLVPDEKLVGGGIHMTGSRGRLDVHVDFNYLRDRDLHRRLNIILFLNRDWHDEWGGCLELWDQQVKTCVHTLQPIFNRCVVFATSEISFHGVTEVNCPPGEARKSFAGYYYTADPPSGWDGSVHSTIFRARPDERLKAHVLMPLERFSRWCRKQRRNLASLLKARTSGS